jgi:hypothetical protein
MCHMWHSVCAVSLTACCCCLVLMGTAASDLWLSNDQTHTTWTTLYGNHICIPSRATASVAWERSQSVASPFSKEVARATCAPPLRANANEGTCTSDRTLTRNKPCQFSKLVYFKSVHDVGQWHGTTVKRQSKVTDALRSCLPGSQLRRVPGNTAVRDVPSTRGAVAGLCIANLHLWRTSRIL